MASKASPRILYYETSAYAPSSGHFLEALAESGTDFRFFDEAQHLRGLRTSRVHKIAYRLLGRRPLEGGKLNRELLRATCDFQPDVLLVTKGPHVRADTLEEIRRRTGAYLVNLATDDPFNPANRTPDLVGSIPAYDLYLSTKRAIMADLRRAGAKRVEFVTFGYKPAEHYPEAPATAAEQACFDCDVAFIGGADPDRVPLLERIARMPGVKLALYGGRWERWPQLRSQARGFVYGRDYRLAVGGARVSLGLVRRANRDGHAMRTFELPACGGCVLAEDTAEHRELFPGPDEFAYFGRDEDVPERLAELLADANRRRRMVEGARKRLLAGNHRYIDRLRQILALLPAKNR